METKIVSCNCKHEFQDKKYGKGKRVHNKMTGKEGLWKCTICENTSSTGGVLTGRKSGKKK